MAGCRAVTKGQAVKYAAATRSGKSQILDAVCAVTGFIRDYARRALKAALGPQVVRSRAARAPVYDADVVAALEKCWAVTSAPTEKRLAHSIAMVAVRTTGLRVLQVDEALEALRLLVDRREV